MGCGRDTFRRNMRHPRRLRRGLSFVEFVGCMLALGSGLAIGSVYLGIDMKTMFVGIMERADLFDPGFFGEVAAADEVVENSEVAPSGERQSPGDESTSDWTDQQRQAATELYWQGLMTCVREDVAHRKLENRGDKKWRLFDYLGHRRKGHQNATRSIEKLDRAGVDQRLVEHGDQLLNWHLAGEKVYAEAIRLLTDSAGDKLSGPLAEQWRSTATQHRMEERLVRDKHAAVADYLSHAYNDAAPFERGF